VIGRRTVAAYVTLPPIAAMLRIPTETVAGISTRCHPCQVMCRICITAEARFVKIGFKVVLPQVVGWKKRAYR